MVDFKSVAADGIGRGGRRDASPPNSTAPGTCVAHALMVARCLARAWEIEQGDEGKRRGPRPLAVVRETVTGCGDALGHTVVQH
jgi:hypothetical protein